MRSLGFIYSLFFIHRYMDSLLGYPKILMVLVTEPHLRYSLSAFITCFLEYISQFLSVPVRVQVFIRTTNFPILILPYRCLFDIHILESKKADQNISATAGNIQNSLFTYSSLNTTVC